RRERQRVLSLRLRDNCGARKPESMRTRAHLRRRRGFTLVELMISLVMGLIIALAVIALARAATTTFHEQARMSSIEMALRAGSERLRSDLSKISYMSTANMRLDPRIARRPNGTTATPPELADLRGIRILRNAGAPKTQGTYTLAATNGLSPD